jgi:hypothetical protein
MIELTHYGDVNLTWEIHVNQSVVKEPRVLEAAWKYHEALLDYAGITQIHYQETEVYK